MANFSQTVGFFLTLAVVSLHLRTALAIGATIIRSRRGWLFTEGVDVVLDCQVFTSGGHATDYASVCSRVGFTRDSAVVTASADPRYAFSGPFHEALSSSVNCTMTLRRVRVTDSASYGCCWIDATSGQCPPHPVQALTVTPLTTTTITNVASTTSRTTTSTPSLVPESSMTETQSDRPSTTHRKGQGGQFTPSQTSHSPLAENEVSRLPNDALIQSGAEGTSIHQAAWSVVLAATIVLILVVVGVWCVKRRRSAGASVERLPEGEEETMEPHPHEGEDDIGTNEETQSLDSSG